MIGTCLFQLRRVAGPAFCVVNLTTPPCDERVGEACHRCQCACIVDMYVSAGYHVLAQVVLCRRNLSKPSCHKLEANALFWSWHFTRALSRSVRWLGFFTWRICSCSRSRQPRRTELSLGPYLYTYIQAPKKSLAFNRNE